MQLFNVAIECNMQLLNRIQLFNSCMHQAIRNYHKQSVTAIFYDSYGTLLLKLSKLLALQ